MNKKGKSKRRMFKSKKGGKSKRGVAAGDFNKKYVLSNTVLGKGAYGEVKKGQRRNGGRAVAVKIMDKSGMKNSDLDKLYGEVQILQKLKHPNVVRVYDFFDEPDRFLIVMEYVDGGELFDKIVDDDTEFTENSSRKIIKTITEALQHCHKNNIVHRDIKPENILLTKEGNIKLADFNLSRQVSPGEMQFSLLQTMCGTPNYVAPEILTGRPYDYKCDIWSLGVIAFLLLSGGYLPFFINPKREGKDELLAKVKSGKWKFTPEKVWTSVSDQGKDLVKKLLVKEPSARLSYSQVLAHPWFKAQDSHLKNVISLSGMNKFNQKRRLLATAMARIAAQTLFDLMGPKGHEDDTAKGEQSEDQVHQSLFEESKDLFEMDDDFD